MMNQKEGLLHEQIEFSTNNVDDILNLKIKINNDDMINFMREVADKFDGNFQFINCFVYAIIKKINIKVYVEDCLIDNITIFYSDRILFKEFGLSDCVRVEGDYVFIKILDNNERFNYLKPVTMYKYRINVMIEFNKLENLIICNNWIGMDKDILLNCEMIR